MSETRKAASDVERTTAARLRVCQVFGLSALGSCAKANHEAARDCSLADRRHQVVTYNVTERMDNVAKGKVKLTASGKAGKEFTDSKSNVTYIGGAGKNIATCNELAASLGIDGKRFRGWLRSGAGTGNDGRYTRRAFNVDSDEVKSLMKAAKAALVRG